MLTHFVTCNSGKRTKDSKPFKNYQQLCLFLIKKLKKTKQFGQNEYIETFFIFNNLIMNAYKYDIHI